MTNGNAGMGSLFSTFRRIGLRVGLKIYFSSQWGCWINLVVWIWVVLSSFRLHLGIELLMILFSCDFLLSFGEELSQFLDHVVGTSHTLCKWEIRVGVQIGFDEWRNKMVVMWIVGVSLRVEWTFLVELPLNCGDLKSGLEFWRKRS
jgi:hypothetical protein